MPTGKVRWYDAERGFGFVSNPEGEDVYVGSSVLPDSVEELVKGQRVEYEIVAGRRGPQALTLTVLDDGPRRATRTQHKFSPEQLQEMVQDTITLLDTRVLPSLQGGRRPEKKEARQIAEILRTIAREID